MAKNKKLVDRYKVLYQKIQQITPEVYASLALALHRQCGWEYEQIEELFGVSQLIWEECLDKDINMIEMCLQETGIELRRSSF